VTARCVELTAVYDDGTVERWEGEPQGPQPWNRGPAQSVLDKYESQHEEYSGFKADGSCRVPWPASTVTRPARRVTVVRGYPSPTGERIKMADRPDLTLGEMWPMPPLAMFDADEWYDLRITVEAVPVEVKP
jgi:hypothetical protein